MATSSPLPVAGPPRFFVTARAPLARFPGESKTAIFTPVRPAVHDATTGAFLAAIPLPPGVRSSWQVLAAAPDNRTFVLSGWTGPDSPLRFFRVHLAEDGSPSDPIPVPGLQSDALGAGYVIALSPDATRLAYAVSIPGGVKVSVVDLATGRRHDWSSQAPVVTGLAWAPDGRRIALVVGGWGIGVLDLGSQGSDLLTATRLVKPGDDLPLLEAVAYTPDGSALIYSAGHAVMRIPVDGGGEPRVLARLTLPADASMTLRFSLDGTGRYLLFAHRWRVFRVDLVDGSTTSMPIKADEHSGEGDSPDVAW
ncbi:TolB family protein [Microbispora sp. CA-135349]|uniref:TolB family protein n=1 Tax=Microbispora sp. CA-135349 TaxID=3239953 RepID=UPI003D91B014